MSLLTRLLARGTVVLANSASKLQSLQMRLTAGEVNDDMEHFEPYGFTSHPLAGAEGVVTFIGGDRSHAIALVIADRRYRLQSLASGEVAIYTDEGDKIHFKRGRIDRHRNRHAEHPRQQRGELRHASDQPDRQDRFHRRSAGRRHQPDQTRARRRTGRQRSDRRAGRRQMMLISPNLHAALTRSVLISLFTWRRAADDDALDDDERFGWWGDTFPTVADDRIGSRLWLLRRVKLTRQTQMDAEFYAREALQWLIDDGHCSAIDIISERLDAQRLNLRTVLTLADGERLDINPDNSWQVIYAV
jgi:phage gp46-like protein